MVQLHEMIFRDAHQSLLATRMRTEDMLPIAEKVDEVGFWSLEVWGGATFDVPIRYLNEDPWVRLRKLKEAMPNTPLQMLERAMNIVAYWNFPDDIVKKFVPLAKKNGIDNFRIFDALNDLRNMKTPIEATIEAGGHAQGCLSYTISPVHTVEHFVSQFMELEKMGCHSLCIKDMAGMIAPKRAFDIVKGYKDAGGKLEMDLHSHCTSGMTGMAYMWAADAGIDVLDTAISPISGGTAAMPTESVVAALADTEYATGYDMELLMELREYFMEIWNKYRHLHRIPAMKYDPSVTVHQIPGGMLSNLIFQLEEQGVGDKYDQVLKETAKVREELGYPPLVTPTSQVVGVQAVMNVMFGRYKNVPQETKDYVRGLYGKPPGEIKPEIYEAVLGKDWKDKLIECRPADMLEPMWNIRKEELEKEGLAQCDEDIMTYALYPKVGLKFLQGKAGTEFKSEDLPLPVDNPLTKSLVKSIFPEFTPEMLEGLGKPAVTQVAPLIPTEYSVEINGEAFEVKVEPTGGFVSMVGGEGAATGAASGPPKGDIPGGLKATMQGSILKMPVAAGAEVSEGDVIAVIEAMKMENEIKSEKAGKVAEVYVKEGDTVQPDTVILKLEE